MADYRRGQKSYDRNIQVLVKAHDFRDFIKLTVFHVSQLYNQGFMTAWMLLEDSCNEKKAVSDVVANTTRKDPYRL